MTRQSRVTPTFLARLTLSLVVGLFAVGCEDTTPTTPSNVSTTTSVPPAPSVGALRVAQLTVDARTVDVAIDGQSVFPAVAFPGVSSYVELTAGEHRVQFFPAGSTRAAILENTVFVNGGEAVTVAILGTRRLELFTVRDDRATVSGRARVRFFNAVDDFPASLDLAVINGPLVVANVVFPQASSYQSLVPGIYALELRRGGTAEALATLTGANLPGSSASTVFAVGSLARGDIRVVVARDGG